MVGKWFDGMSLVCGLSFGRRARRFSYLVKFSISQNSDVSNSIEMLFLCHGLSFIIHILYVLYKTYMSVSFSFAVYYFSMLLFVVVHCD